MRVALISTAFLILTSCDQLPVADSKDSDPGRYHAVGIYSAGTSWKALKADEKNLPDLTAHIRHDEVVIVTIDGKTGEMRQCGNYSGFCVKLNAWDKAPPASTPVQFATEPSTGESAVTNVADNVVEDDKK